MDKFYVPLYQIERTSTECRKIKPEVLKLAKQKKGKYRKKSETT